MIKPRAIIISVCSGFILSFIIGLVAGANISLLLYACILAGKESDKKM